MEEIADYISDDNPERALTFVNELQARAAKAAEHPKAYPVRDDLQHGLRSIAHRGYTILFREMDDHVRVVDFLSSRRNLRNLTFD